MNFNIFFTLYAISLPVLCVLDGIWLGLVAKDFYQSRIGHLFGEVNWVAVGIFYPVYLLGITYFCIYPAVMQGSWKVGLCLGAVFGFFAYFTYDMTNLATLKGWPLSVVFVDVAWGVFLAAAVSALTTAIYLAFR